MIVLSHISALVAYRTPELARRLMNNRSAGITGVDVSRVEAPSTADASRIHTAYGIPLPLHALVFHECDRRKASKRVHCHMCGEQLPPESVIHLDDDVYVCSPELTFIQLCCRSDLENRLMLGSELASSFAINPAGRHGLVKRPPVLTTRTLLEAVDTQPDLPGAAKARASAPYLVANARSPKECELALLLTLPRRLGGRGIRNVDVNKRIELSPEAQAIARRAYLVADLFLRASSTDTE